MRTRLPRRCALRRTRPASPTARPCSTSKAFTPSRCGLRVCLCITARGCCVRRGQPASCPAFGCCCPLQAHRIAHELWCRGRRVMAAALQSRMSEVGAWHVPTGQHPGCVHLRNAALRHHQLSRLQPLVYVSTFASPPLVPQLLLSALRACQVFAVDIHPAARFGKGILLDHGTGVVIGETAELGNNVSILQNVTLGGKCCGRAWVVCGAHVRRIGPANVAPRVGTICGCRAKLRWRVAISRSPACPRWGAPRPAHRHGQGARRPPPKNIGQRAHRRVRLHPGQHPRGQGRAGWATGAAAARAPAGVRPLSARPLWLIERARSPARPLPVAPRWPRVRWCSKQCHPARWWRGRQPRRLARSRVRPCRHLTARQAPV